MDISSYLSELLQTRKSVGISGLGTVFKKKMPGKYDVETHSFFPPAIVLDFMAEIQEETALPDYICEQRQVSPEIAVEAINEFSTAINRQLDSGNEVLLGNLGRLYKDGQQVKFSMPDQQNLRNEYYGLPPVEELPEYIQEPIDPAALIATPVPPMENPVTLPEPVMPPQASAETWGTIDVQKPKEVRKSINDTFKTEEQLRTEIEALNYYRSKSPVSAPVVQEDADVLWKLKEEQKPESAINPDENPRFYHSENEEIKGTAVYLKIIYGLLILVILAGLAYMIQPSLFNKLTGDKPGLPHPAQQPASTQTTLSLIDSPTKDSILQSQTAILQDTLAGKPIVKPTDTTTVYEVIGASMHNQKEADAFIALMKKSGIEAKVVTNMAGRRLKMSIGTFKDEETARQELEKLSRRLKIPGIYIYKNKQK